VVVVDVVAVFFVDAVVLLVEVAPNGTISFEGKVILSVVE
jgi:hypothetical protein